MNKWKKLTSLVLVGIMAGSLAACGGSGGSGNSGGSEDSGSGSTAESGNESSSSDSDSGEKVTLNMLFNDTDENVQAEMAYVMEHLPEVLPNVEVELEMVPGDAQTYETKVRTMISAGGEGLDVWWERGGSWATPILESESALPLDDYLEASGQRQNEAGRSTGGTEKSAKGTGTKSRTEKPREVKLKFTYKEQLEFESIDEEIEALETKIAELEQDMAEAATQYSRLNEIV